MSWGQSGLLYALWALPLLIIAVWAALRARASALLRLGALMPGLSSVGAARLHRRRLIGLVVAAVLAVVALAQPRWGYRWQDLKREGLAMVVVLDVSASMDAQDVSPSRMERAQRKVLDLLDLLNGDRVGLVLFAAGPYPRVPLTLDYGAVREIVRDSDTQSLGAQGSDLGAAIDQALVMLEPAKDSDRAILIVSDGEDQVGDALAAAGRASEAGVHIYAMGVGTPDGAPIPLEGGGFKKDNSGEVVMTKLDEDTLKAVASAGQGAYVRGTAGAADLHALYDDEIGAKLHKTEQGSRRDKVWDERYQWPLAAAFLAATLASLLRARPARAAALALFLVFGAADARAASDVERLSAAQTEHPGDLGIAEQLGGALYKDGDYSRAEDVLRSVADRSTDADQRARARYNAGLAAYRTGRLTDAMTDWQDVLKDQPKHAPAAQNLAAAQKELQLRLQEQDKQQQSGQNQDDQQQQGDQQQSGQNQDDQQQQGDQQQQNDQQQQGDQQQQSGQQQDPQDQQGTREARPAQQGDTGSAGEATAADAQQDPSGGDTGQSGQAEQGEDGDHQRPGAISPDAAQRLIDGLEEGNPRVIVNPASKGGKDW